jgi:hypothetical protein
MKAEATPLNYYTFYQQINLNEMFIIHVNLMCFNNFDCNLL